MAKTRQIDIYKQELELLRSAPGHIRKVRGWTKEEFLAKVAFLEEKITLSKRGKSSKVKGAVYERKVAKLFQERFTIELKRTPLSGGFAKGNANADDFRGDIIPVDSSLKFNLHLECKDQMKWNLDAWIKQAEEDCPKHRIPVIVFHKRQKVDEGKVIRTAGEYVTLKLEDFLKLVDERKVVEYK